MRATLRCRKALRWWPVFIGTKGEVVNVDPTLGAGSTDADTELAAWANDVSDPVLVAPEEVDQDAEQESADDGPAAPPDPTAWLQSDDGKKKLERERLLYGRDYTATFARAVAGDADAQTKLQGDRYGKQLWEAHQRAAREEARKVTQAESTYQRYAGMNGYERAEAFEQQPAMARWFYEYADYRAQAGAPNPSPAVQAGEGRVDRMYERLRGREAAAVLTDADWEALHPVNYEHLDETDALAELSAAYAERVSARRTPATGGSTQPAAKPRPQPAEAAKAAAAKAPPVVSGKPSAQVTFEQARDAYADDPTPEKRDAYMRLRPKHW